MPIAWHPKRWWNFCMSEDEKEEIDTIFIEKSVGSIQNGGIETFWLKKLDNKMHKQFSLLKCFNTPEKIWPR